MLTELEILGAFQRALKPGDRVRHIADWKAGTLVRAWHPMYDAGVCFDDSPKDPTAVYQKNLYPEWWPAPPWAKIEPTLENGTPSCVECRARMGL